MNSTRPSAPSPNTAPTAPRPWTSASPAPASAASVHRYVHEMPVWKTSYRLQLPELDSEGKTKGQLMLHGWAIVENTTDQDWSDVQLSLVSGRPVSFQMDLYEPLFATRPWVSVPTIPGVFAAGLRGRFRRQAHGDLGGAWSGLHRDLE